MVEEQWNLSKIVILPSCAEELRTAKQCSDLSCSVWNQGTYANEIKCKQWRQERLTNHITLMNHLSPQSTADTIAWELCSDKKAAVATVLMRLPAVENGCAPIGGCGITCASALVTCKHPGMKGLTVSTKRKSRVPKETQTCLWQREEKYFLPCSKIFYRSCWMTCLSSLDVFSIGSLGLAIGRKAEMQDILIDEVLFVWYSKNVIEWTTCRLHKCQSPRVGYILQRKFFNFIFFPNWERGGRRWGKEGREGSNY